jgi:hypothetical protein
MITCFERCDTKEKGGILKLIEKTEVSEETDGTLLRQSSLIKWKHPMQKKKKISDVQLDMV